MASPDALRTALREPVDLVVAAEHCADLSPWDILDALRELSPGVGCVVVGKVLDEFKATELMRAGARDFVPQQAWSRLMLVMQREIARCRERALAQTQRRELEEQLRLAQKMEALGRLAGGVAHEFNNALTVVISFAGFVRDDLGPDDPRRQDILEVLRAADKAASLTRQLLTFSRRRPADPRTVDLNTLVSNQEKILRRMLGERIELVSQLQDNPWSVQLDPALFEQLLMNLVVNARDAMSQGGTLVLRTRNVSMVNSPQPSKAVRVLGDVWWQPHVLLEVADTGEGIKEDDLDHVFEPLFTTRGTKASGLGLSTCYGIVKQAKGGIDLESQVGLGTSVRVAFPRAAGNSTATRLEAAVSRLAGKETVLVVEDEERVLQTVVRPLLAAGYAVIAESHPEKVLAAINDHVSAIDLLVTDVVMPGVSGTEIVRQFLVRRPDLKVLFMTGYADETLTDSPHSDRVQVLSKPFSSRRLLRTVRQLLDA